MLTHAQTTPNGDAGLQKSGVMYVVLISLVAAMGGLLFGYDWVVIGGAEAFYEAYFNLTDPAQIGWAMSAALVGCLAGSIFSGGLSDRFGRKSLLLVSGLLFAVSSVLTGWAPSYTSFIIWRMIGGVAIGMASNLSPMYIAEVAPAAMRGRLVSMNQLTIVIGILLAQVVNWKIGGLEPVDPKLDEKAQIGVARAAGLASQLQQLTQTKASAIGGKIGPLTNAAARLEFVKQAAAETWTLAGTNQGGFLVVNAQGEPVVLPKAMADAKFLAKEDKDGVSLAKKLAQAAWPTNNHFVGYALPLPGQKTEVPRLDYACAIPGLEGWWIAAGLFQDNQKVLEQKLGLMRQTWNGQSGWRWMFGAVAIPSLFFFLFTLAVPESPRWLVKYGRDEKARQVLARIGGAAYAEKEIASIKATLLNEIEQVKFGDLLDPKMLRVLVMGVTLAVLQQWCGINVIFNYAKQVFGDAGYSVSDILFNIVITGSVNLVFTFVAIQSVDKFGRRVLMLVGCAGLTVTHTLIGLGYFLNLKGLFVLIPVMAAIGCYSMSLAPITWVLISEIFPNRIRGAAVAVAVSALWIACFILTYTFPILNSTLGPAKTFWLYAAICAAGFIYIVMNVPETKGKTLEQIEKELVD